MCTLIALHRCIADSSLVVAANRDEFLERPTEGPALRELREGSATGGSPRRGQIVAPLDLRAGGTWLGVAARGLFAAVTNRRCSAPDPSRRSRGWLVMAALGEPTARRAAERLSALPAASYNPFNLFVADADSAHLVSYDERPERIDLAPGPHVIGNVHPDAPSPKLERLRREVAELCTRGIASPETLGEVCRAHAGAAPLEATCVHAGGYGTRSSTLLRLGEVASLHYADGPPCENPYRDMTPLLHDLGIAGSSGAARA